MLRKIEDANHQTWSKKNQQDTKRWHIIIYGVKIYYIHMSHEQW